MSKTIPCLVAAILLTGCKQYTVVDLSFLEDQDQARIKTVITDMTGIDASAELNGKQLVIKATTCEKKRIRRFVDEVRLQTGFQRARWGP